jgi:hypothetical protein
MQPAVIRRQNEMAGGIGQPPVGLVTCPNCMVAMLRVSLKRSETEKTLHEASYHCPRCDTETRRWIVL